jgi:hypothetical protein
MKRNSYSSLAFAVVVALGLVASSLAIAADGIDCTPPVNTPSANSAVIMQRVWNDCPASTLTLVNNYPALISINDTDVECVGWTNLHVWAFSEDGVTPAIFENCSHYKFSCLFNGSFAGAGVGEGGLRLSPWWSLLGDGRFMARIGGNGEIACFGGRLPFYSFTSNFGVTYVPGTDLWMEIKYAPHALTVADPATITYSIQIGANLYTSGPLAFDQGNPAEGHGEYGALYPAQAGGFLQEPNGSGGALFNFTGQWKDIYFEGPSATPANRSSWGQLKGMYR